MTLRIGHYFHSLDPALGGEVAHVTDLAILTASRGLDVTIYTPRPKPRAEKLSRTEGVRILPAPRPALGGRVFTRRQAAEVAEKLCGVDVVHLHGSWDPCAARVSWHLRRMRQPYVVTPHGMLDDWCMAQKGLKKRIYLRLIGRNHFKGARCLLYCAQGELEQARKWVCGRPGVVVPAATDLSPYEDLPGPEVAKKEIQGAGGEGPLVLFLSRVDQKKGLEVLLQAMAVLRERGHMIPLVIAGPGKPAYVQQLRTLATRLGVAEHTHFVGLVKGAQKVSLMQRASVLALPTKQENFGLVLTESMAAETPVITTRGVDIWPEINACNGGLIVDRTPTAFADAIAEILGDPERAEVMGRNGRAWVFANLRRDVLAEKFIEVYRQVSRGDGGAKPENALAATPS